MIKFQNHFTQSLPADPTLENSIRLVERCCFSLVVPTTTKQPKLITVFQLLMQQLGLSIEQIEFGDDASKRQDWACNKAGCSMLSCSS